MEGFSRTLYLVLCPHCRKDLYLPAMEREEEVCCSKCASVYQYQVVRFLDKSVGSVRDNAWEYKLRVQANLESDAQALSFQFNSKDLSFFKHDRLLVMRRKNKVAFIQNLTEGWSYYFQGSRNSQWLGTGTLCLCLGVLGYTFLGGMGLLSIPVVAGISIYLTASADKRRRLLMAEQLMDAKHVQACLELIYQDRLKSQEIRDKSDRNIGALERLGALIAEQERLELPTDRLDIVHRAIHKTRQHQTSLDSILQQYASKEGKMWLDVEIRNITALMPDSIIKYRLQSQELEAQYQAEQDAMSEINLLVANYAD